MVLYLIIYSSFDILNIEKDLEVVSQIFSKILFD